HPCVVGRRLARTVRRRGTARASLRIDARNPRPSDRAPGIDAGVVDEALSLSSDDLRARRARKTSCSCRAKPAEKPCKPAGEPRKPAREPCKPGGRPCKPAGQPRKPAGEPCKPAGQPCKPQLPRSLQLRLQRDLHHTPRLRVGGVEGPLQLVEVAAVARNGE